MTLRSDRKAGGPFGEVKGHAYSAGTSRRVLAWVVRDENGLRLIDKDGAVLFSGAPTARERISGGPCLMTFGDAWRFDTEDVNGVDALLGAPDDGWLSDLEVWHPRLIAVIAACVFGVYGIWRWGLDLLAYAAIAMTPGGFVTAIDSSNLAAMDRLLAAPTTLSASDQAMVREVFEDIAEVAPFAPYGDYTLMFRDMSAVGPNAFALPGGTVVVTDDLVEKFGDPDLIAGVLGHELAHVSERHSLRQLYRSLSTYVLIAMIVGDVGPILEDALLEGSALASLSYSRGHESKADAIGVATAYKAGYDPTALATFFETLQREYGDSGPEWMSTHPANAERIERIKELAEAQTR